MDQDYAKTYATLARSHWWWTARNRYVLERVDGLAVERPTGGFQRILDVGCGDAVNLPRLSQYGPTEGLEPDANTLSASSIAEWKIYREPFGTDFRPGVSYDLITMLDVLEHIPNEGDALEAARHLLQPEGLILLTVPALQVLWTHHDDMNHHQRRYDRARLRSALERAGFEVLELRFLFHSLVVPKLATVLKERIMPPGPDTTPGIPPAWINNLLHRVCRGEQKLFNRVRPPLGTSLFALARKPEDKTVGVGPSG